MLGITFSSQNYNHYQQFLSKLRENNENDMTSVVWAVIAFGPRVWLPSARRHYVLRATCHYFYSQYAISKSMILCQKSNHLVMTHQKEKLHNRICAIGIHSCSICTLFI